MLAVQHSHLPAIVSDVVLVHCRCGEMTLKQEARRSIALSGLRMMQLRGGCGSNWCSCDQESGQWGGFRDAGLGWFNDCSLRLGHRTVSEAATYGQDIGAAPLTL
jgi:hypothetical protein